MSSQLPTEPDCGSCTGGKCERHGITKTARMIELCRARGEYYAAWEAGYGPRQQAKGLGDKVAKAILIASGGRVKPCGGCKDRQVALNEIGKSIGIGNE